jgi:hypothetical protein
MSPTYLITVNSMTTEQRITSVLVEREDLASALELITGARTLVAASVIALAPEAARAAAASAARWGPEWCEQLRQWARGLPVAHVTGTPDDPLGKEAALRHAASLAATIDGKITEHGNGVAVERRDAAEGDQPEAFVAFAPLPGQMN